MHYFIKVSIIKDNIFKMNDFDAFNHYWRVITLGVDKFFDSGVYIVMAQRLDHKVDFRIKNDDWQKEKMRVRLIH